MELSKDMTGTYHLGIFNEFEKTIHVSFHSDSYRAVTLGKLIKEALQYPVSIVVSDGKDIIYMERPNQLKGE